MTEQEYEEREKIIAAYMNIFLCCDAHEWDKCRTTMVEEPLVDYSSLNGLPPAKIKATTLMENWKNFLPKFKATMHFCTNHVVHITKDTATGFCYGHAIHYLPDAPGGDCWEVYGTYDFNLVKTPAGWKVESVKYNLKYQCGNKDLPAIASKQ